MALFAKTGHTSISNPMLVPRSPGRNQPHGRFDRARPARHILFLATAYFLFGLHESPRRPSQISISNFF